MRYPFDNWTVVNDDSNQSVVKERATMSTATHDDWQGAPPAEAEEATEVRREIEVEASPEEVFEALITEEGRERWLEEPEREIHIESAEPPHRLVWWWAGEELPATRVEFTIVALPRTTRVVVTESAPSFPLVALAASFQLVAA
jgi:uncharacterized protein YndB with AHSA1/START domain